MYYNQGENSETINFDNCDLKTCTFYKFAKPCSHITENPERDTHLDNDTKNREEEAG